MLRGIDLHAQCMYSVHYNLIFFFPPAPPPFILSLVILFIIIGLFGFCLVSLCFVLFSNLSTAYILCPLSVAICLIIFLSFLFNGILNFLLEWMGGIISINWDGILYWVLTICSIFSLCLFLSNLFYYIVLLRRILLYYVSCS